MHFACRFVNQGKHDIKWQMIFFQQFGGKSIHMVGKVTGKDSCQMKTPALLRIGFVHLIRERTGNRFQQLGIFRSFCFNKERYFPKINFTLFAERLHRIKYSVAFRMTFPNIHRDATCRMYQQRMLLPISDLRQQFDESGIFQ